MMMGSYCTSAHGVRSDQIWRFRWVILHGLLLVVLCLVRGRVTFGSAGAGLGLLLLCIAGSLNDASASG